MTQTETQTTERKPGLYTKIAAITAAVSWVPEDGRHAQGYRYTSKDAVLAALKPLLQQHPIAIIPRMTDREDRDIGQTKNGSPVVLTHLTVEYTLVDGESGEVATIPWTGSAVDYDGKGLTKASASALKTFLINLFQIPCGEDEEDVPEYQPKQPPRQAQQRQRQEPHPQRQRQEHPSSNGNGNGMNRGKVLGFLGGYVDQAKSAHIFGQTYPVPDFTDWTVDQLKTYGSALKAELQRHSEEPAPPLEEVRARLTAAQPTAQPQEEVQEEVQS